MDKKTCQILALKKVFDAFENMTDAQRIYREIVFLTELGRHQNVVHLVNVIRGENVRDIYMVFEYLGILFLVCKCLFIDTDLHVIIRSSLLEPIQKQFIIYQCFKALKFIHSSGLLHRDIKVCIYNDLLFFFV
jgi:mitogen-activated protein kinase 15